MSRLLAVGCDAPAGAGSPPARRSRFERLMPWLRRILAAVVVVALIVVVRFFPDHNTARVDIDLLVTQFSAVPLWFALATTFVTGLSAALLVCGLLLLKARLLGRRYRRAIADLESEVHHLRNLPLATRDFAETQGDDEPPPGRAMMGS